MRKNPSRYFLFADTELEIKTKQVDDFIYLWERGHSLRNIARQIKLDHNTTGLLCYDLSMHERIHPRPNGIFDNMAVMKHEGT